MRKRRVFEAREAREALNKCRGGGEKASAFQGNWIDVSCCMVIEVEWVGCKKGKSGGKGGHLWRVFFQPQEIESVHSWAGTGQVDIRSYREKTGKEEPWEAHMSGFRVCGGGQSKSDEDRMAMWEHQPAAGIPGTEALPGGWSDSPVATGLITTSDLPWTRQEITVKSLHSHKLKTTMVAVTDWGQAGWQLSLPAGVFNALAPGVGVVGSMLTSQPTPKSALCCEPTESFRVGSRELFFPDHLLEQISSTPSDGKWWESNWDCRALKETGEQRTFLSKRTFSNFLLLDPSYWANQLGTHLLGTTHSLPQLLWWLSEASGSLNWWQLDFRTNNDFENFPYFIPQAPFLRQHVWNVQFHSPPNKGLFVRFYVLETSSVKTGLMPFTTTIYRTHVWAQGSHGSQRLTRRDYGEDDTVIVPFYSWETEAPRN